jgi:hypothetical protein
MATSRNCIAALALAVVVTWAVVASPILAGPLFNTTVGNVPTQPGTVGMPMVFNQSSFCGGLGGGLGGFGGGLGFRLTPPLPSNPVSPVSPVLPPAAGLTSYSPGFGGQSLYNSTNPYSPSNPYNPYNNQGYWPNPYQPYYGDFGLGSTLQGVSSVVYAEGQLGIQNQQAKLLQQDVERSKLDTRRKIYDEWLYEQANTPSLQDRREQMQRYELRRAMKDPPMTEILNGSSLDTVYKDLLTKQNLWAKGPVMTLDESVLKHINMTSRSGGNTALLKRVKDGEPLPWPTVLKMPAYKADYDRINQRLPDAVQQAETKGFVDPGRVQNMKDYVQGLQATVSANINDLTPSEVMGAKRFLGQLDEALVALQQPDVADHLNGKVAPRGRTVTDFLQYMSSKGLGFGPATSGDEAAYIALHNYLVGFNLALGFTGGGTQP